MDTSNNKGDKMTRRKAALVETAEQGWCLGILIKHTSAGEVAVALFESAQDQVVTEQLATNIKFMDGNPESIPVFE